MIKRKTPLVPVMKKPLIPFEQKASLPDLYRQIPSDVIQKIVGYISLNLPPKEACMMVGVSPAYFSNLVRENVEGLGELVAQAKLSQKIKHLKNIYDLNKNWKPSAWYLERTDKATYGKEVTINATNNSDEDQVMIIGDRKIIF